MLHGGAAPVNSPYTRRMGTMRVLFLLAGLALFLYLLVQLGPGFEGHPFLSDVSLTVTYLGWAGLWVALVLGLAGLAFQRRDV